MGGPTARTNWAPTMPKKLTPRQIANRMNRKRWRGLTAEGLERLRAAAQAGRPWEKSTGPRSTAGKRTSRRNARRHDGRSVVLLPEPTRRFLEQLRAAERGEGALPAADLAVEASEALAQALHPEAFIRAAKAIRRYQRLIWKQATP